MKTFMTGFVIAALLIIATAVAYEASGISVAQYVGKSNVHLNG